MSVTVVGLDLSLTATGVARIGHDREADGLRVSTQVLGSKAAGDAVHARADRLTDLAASIVHATMLWGRPSLVCIERPAYSSNSGSVTDRAGLWWLVVARMVRGQHVPVVDVVNNHLKAYATGKGNAAKDAVLAETVRRYGVLVPTLADNNEADALQLAALGYDHLTGTPVVQLPETHRRAVRAVKWTVPGAGGA